VVAPVQQLNTHQKNTSTGYVAGMTRRKSTGSEVKTVLVFQKKVMFVALRNSGISPAAKQLVVLKEAIYSMEVVVVRGMYLG
jgi:hypothetical protein